MGYEAWSGNINGHQTKARSYSILRRELDLWNWNIGILSSSGMYQNGLFQLKCIKGQGEVIFGFEFISTEHIPALSLFILIKKKGFQTSLAWHKYSFSRARFSVGVKQDNCTEIRNLCQLIPSQNLAILFTFFSDTEMAILKLFLEQMLPTIMMHAEIWDFDI